MLKGSHTADIKEQIIHKALRYKNMQRQFAVYIGYFTFTNFLYIQVHVFSYN
jgi:hypothetical protein